MIEFKKVKSENKLQPFGSSDKSFRPDQFFAGFRHAHLTSDISVIYTLEGSNPAIIKLYGIFSHDDIGTGQPLQVKVQQSMSKKLRNQRFN